MSVALDAAGLCTYCRHWDANAATWTDWPRLGQAFRARVDKLRGQYQYDALVGISGGKDSTYVLYHLVKTYGLKVLALTVDNHFLSDQARANIGRVVDALGVEHFFYRPDWELHRAFYTAATRELADPCVGCAIPIYYVVMKICFERRIPFFINGRSPFQMFRNYYPGTGDVFIKMQEASLAPHDFASLLPVQAAMDAEARRWLARLFPDPALRARVYQEFFLDHARLTADFVPEFLGYFIFHPYDEQAIKAEMEAAVGYRRPARDAKLSHDDCLIHDASDYLFRRVQGLNMNVAEVAAMLRRGAIGQDEARALIARYDQATEHHEQSLATLLGAIGMSRAELDARAAALAAAKARKFDCH